MTDKVAGRTRHGEITIDEMAEMQPGMARVMDEVAKRYYYLYYAANGGNWKLAAHELNEVKAAMRIAKVTRPKYAQDLIEFEEKYLDPLSDTIREQNWEKFNAAYNKGVEGSDIYHDKYGYTYIRFTLPPDPPGHMHLGPPEKLRREKKD